MTKNNAALAEQIDAIMLENGWAQSVDRQGAQLPFGRIEGAYWVVNGRPNGVDDHVGVAGPGAEFREPIPLAYALVERAKGLQRAQAELVATTALSVVTPPVVEAEPEPPTPDPREEELAAARAEAEALRARVAELEATLPPLLPEPDALMADYGEVGGVAPDLADILLPDEPLATAVERMTPGLDELLDMAQLLSEPSFEAAISTIPTERFNEWTERLFAERGVLRTRRGTEDENLARENLISRVATVFARVGAKR